MTGETVTLAYVDHGDTGETPAAAATHGITLEAVNRHGKVDLPFNDAGFALIDFAALLRFRCASRYPGSTGGLSSLRLSPMFPATYDNLWRDTIRLPGKRTSRLATARIA